jgi:hypothetical protein
MSDDTTVTFDNLDDFSTIGATVNERKTKLNLAARENTGDLYLALQEAIAAYVNSNPADTDSMKARKRAHLTGGVADLLTTNGIAGLVSVLNLTHPETMGDEPKGLGGGKPAPVKTDTVDPETTRKVAMADAIIAACAGDVDRAEKNTKTFAHFLPNGQFMRFMMSSWFLVNDQNSGVNLMNDPDTKEVVLSSHHKAEQERKGFEHVFETLLVELFGQGNLPSGDRSKQLSAAIVKIDDLGKTGTLDEATILAEVVKVTGVPSVKDDTLKKYLDRIGNAELVTFRTDVAKTLGIPRKLDGQPALTDAEWHTELVKGAGWYSAAWKNLFQAAIDPKNVFKLEAAKAEKLNIVNLVKAMVDAAVANSPAKVLTDPSAQEISDYLYNQLGYNGTQLNGKNAYQLFAMLTSYVNTQIRNHYSGLSATPTGIRGAEVVDDYKLNELPTPAPAI